jgi:hypothetical protein
MRLTEEQQDKACVMRREFGLSLRAIAHEFGCSHETIQRATDPEFVKRRNAHTRAVRAGQKCRDNRSWALDVESKEERNPLYDPLRDGPRRWRSPAAYMLGEPPIGCSALERLKW